MCKIIAIERPDELWELRKESTPSQFARWVAKDFHQQGVRIPIAGPVATFPTEAIALIASQHLLSMFTWDTMVT